MSRGVSSFLLSSHFLASVLVNCPRCAHRWSARSNSRVVFSASAVCVVLTLGSCSVLLAYSMLSALAIFFFGRGTSSPSRCHRRTASSVWRAAKCTVHRGQPPFRRHRSVSTLVEASGLCCRGCRLITSRSVCLRRGGHPSEAPRFGSVGWHSCPG